MQDAYLDVEQAHALLAATTEGAEPPVVPRRTSSPQHGVGRAGGERPSRGPVPRRGTGLTLRPDFPLPPLPQLQQRGPRGTASCGRAASQPTCASSQAKRPKAGASQTGFNHTIRRPAALRRPAAQATRPHAAGGRRCKACGSTPAQRAPPSAAGPPSPHHPPIRAMTASGSTCWLTKRTQRRNRGQQRRWSGAIRVPARRSGLWKWAPRSLEAALPRPPARADTATAGSVSPPSAGALLPRGRRSGTLDNACEGVNRLLGRLVDPENSRSLMSQALSRGEQKGLQQQLGQLYHFDSRNPTGAFAPFSPFANRPRRGNDALPLADHYVLNLATAPDRDLLQRLLDLDACMRKWRRAHDLGPINCFRNATYAPAAGHAGATPRGKSHPGWTHRLDGMSLEVRPGFAMPTGGKMELDFTVSRFPRAPRRAVSRSVFRSMLRRLRLRVLMPREDVRLLRGRLVPVHMLHTAEREEVERQESEWEREFSARERENGGGGGGGLDGVDVGQEGEDLPLRERARRVNTACVGRRPGRVSQCHGGAASCRVAAQRRACKTRAAPEEAGGDGAVHGGAGRDAASLRPRVRPQAANGLPGRRPRPPRRPPQLQELRACAGRPTPAPQPAASAVDARRMAAGGAVYDGRRKGGGSAPLRPTDAVEPHAA